MGTTAAALWRRLTHSSLSLSDLQNNILWSCLLINRRGEIRKDWKKERKEKKKKQKERKEHREARKEVKERCVLVVFSGAEVLMKKLKPPIAFFIDSLKNLKAYKLQNRVTFQCEVVVFHSFNQTSAQKDDSFGPNIILVRIIVDAISWQEGNLYSIQA